MEQQEPIPHLFRTEYRKIVSVLCKRFGFAEIETAEDIASDTFLVAAQTWGIKGLPENPVAWLYTVAKNKASTHLQRQAIFSNKVAPALQKDVGAEENTIDLSPQNISDSQLQMMFAICHPSINTEAQVGLALRILCGFGINEIADAFLSNKETINKRLFRAKEKLRTEKVQVMMPGPAEIEPRLGNVLTTLYLLFNEGYYSESNDLVLREDLCLEAMRLTYLLVENDSTNQPAVNALLSLMCFHASRFEARKNKHGEIILYEDQDESLWNHELIARGVYFLRQAAKGNTLNKYQLEASIAYWHTQKTDSADKWENILQLYNHLLQVAYSPVAALNRTYALSKTAGKEAAIKEAEKLSLNNNHYYFVLLAELYTAIDNKKATQYFEQALLFTRNQSEKQLIHKKMHSLVN